MASERSDVTTNATVIIECYQIPYGWEQIIHMCAVCTNAPFKGVIHTQHIRSHKYCCVHCIIESIHMILLFMSKRRYNIQSYILALAKAMQEKKPEENWINKVCAHCSDIISWVCIVDVDVDSRSGRNNNNNNNINNTRHTFCHSLIVRYEQVIVDRGLAIHSIAKRNTINSIAYWAYIIIVQCTLTHSQFA